MKKKILFLTAVLGAYCTLANAWSVTTSGTTVTIDGGTDGLPQNWADLGAANCKAILEAKTIVLKGQVGQYGLSVFNQGKGQAREDGGTGFAATKVDFSDAYFVETENGAGPFTFYEYAPESAEIPKYSPSTTAGEYVEDANGKYIKHENVYYKTNEMTFQYFANLTEAVISTHVESLCQNCFNNMSNLTTTFTIPDNIKFIATGAVDDTPITSLTIPASVEYIQAGAIKNADTNALIEVTVESISTVCAKGGFLKDITVGQTDAGYMNYAILKFPKGAEEYFINQSHELDLATSLNQGKFQAWLDQHYSNAGNGWQEFINTAPGDDVVELENPIVLRTFSDNVAHYVPLCYRAYIVNGVENNNTDGYTLKLQETYAIPANTGVIIYGESVTGSFALPILSGQSWQNDPYDRNDGIQHINNEDINLQNFLVPSTTSEHLTVNVGGPYDADAAREKVLERNFIMTKYSNTTLNSGETAIEAANDYVGFFRVLKAGTLGQNLAYLKLPSDKNTFEPAAGVKFTNPQGMEIVVDNDGITFRSAEWHDPVSTGNWGQRPNALPTLVKSIGEPGEKEYFLSINALESNRVDAGEVYSLQGVRVMNPQKGIYIKDGKKFIVK